MRRDASSARVRAKKTGRATGRSFPGPHGIETIIAREGDTLVFKYSTHHDVWLAPDDGTYGHCALSEMTRLSSTSEGGGCSNDDSFGQGGPKRGDLTVTSQTWEESKKPDRHESQTSHVVQTFARTQKERRDDLQEAVSLQDDTSEPPSSRSGNAI